MNDLDDWEIARNVEQTALETLRSQVAEVPVDTSLEPFGCPCLSPSRADLP
jgi:hypothetical protein